MAKSNFHQLWDAAKKCFSLQKSHHLVCQKHLAEQKPAIETVREVAVKLRSFAQEASRLADRATSLLSQDIPAASEQNAGDKHMREG